MIAGLNLKANQHLAFLAIALLAIAFWFMEVTWKRFQRSHLTRITELEAALQKGIAADFPVPAVAIRWKATFDVLRARSWMEKALWPNVAIPNALILASALGLAALSLAGQLTPPPSSAITSQEQAVQ